MTEKHQQPRMLQSSVLAAEVQLSITRNIANVSPETIQENGLFAV